MTRLLVTKLLRLWAPPPKLTVSQWADAYRYLSQENSPEPGRWSTSRAEYQRGVMDSLSDPAVNAVVVPKAHQVGFTEMLANMIGYHVDQYPSPILVIQPSLQMAESWSKERLDAMFRDTPALSGLISDPRSRDSGNTILNKRFPGGYLAVVGANSPASLAMRPIRIVIADECDKYPASAEDKGDPLTLARHRQTNFWDAKVLLGSTPGHKATSVIWREWLKSDMRTFWVPCPYCGHESSLAGWEAWARVRWDKNAKGAHLPETARLECQAVDPETGEICGARLTDGERWRAISKGRWIASAPFNGIAGFWISGLMSPWVPLEKMAREYLGAKDQPQLLQVWVNEVLGEPWEDGTRLDEHVLMARCEDWGLHAPEPVLVVTCGVDVQKNRIEVERIGWGPGEESWSLGYEIFPGDTTGPEVWQTLDDYLLTPTRTVDGRTLTVSATAIDTGGSDGMTQATCEFVRPRARRRIWGIKGLSVAGRPVWPKKATRNNKGRIDLYPVGVDTAKDVIYSRLRIGHPGPGYCHFPADRDAAWFEQLTIERVMTKYVRGFPRRVYEKRDQDRNEALDARVYGYAALLSLSVVWEREIQRARTAPRVAPVADDGDEPVMPVIAPDLSEKKLAFTRRATRSSFMAR